VWFLLQAMAPLLSSVLVALLIVSNVVATPVENPELIKVPFTKKINRANLKGLVEHDRARARALVQAAQDKLAGRASSISATNVAVSYLANVGVGQPATDYELIIDTGSSNTWVGASTPYQQTSTSKNTGQSFSVDYGSGSVSGEEFTDQVTLSSSLVISKQSIGVASESSGFEGVDGILGIGPLDLTLGTLENENSEIPTVTGNLFSQGIISENLVAVSFEPTTSDDETNGELTFGGTDSSKFTGSISFTSITSTSPANEFWGINQSVNYNGKTILSTTAGIVDTGTTLVLLATNAFDAYKSAIGATLDEDTGLLKVSTKNFDKMTNLNFVIGGETFALTPDAQLWPVGLNGDIGGESGVLYLVVNDLGTPSGEGLDFINGQTFLERFYAVFDTTNNRVGLATTKFTTEIINQ